MNWLFWKSKRQARYVLNLAAFNGLPQNVYDILRRFTPVIGVRQYNKLPAELQQYFIRSGKEQL